MLFWKNILIIVLLAVPLPAVAKQAEILYPPGNTPQERVDFLRSLQADKRISRDEATRYNFGALDDPSADVRKYAAFSSRGNIYLPKLIEVMTTDPDLRVRQFAAMGISHWITDNGTEDCNSVDTIIKHLDKFLIGLKDDSTAQYVVEVLGDRYAGDTPLPCCMPMREKKLVVEALEKLKTSRPTHSIATYWSASFPLRALENIKQCDNK